MVHFGCVVFKIYVSHGLLLCDKLYRSASLCLTNDTASQTAWRSGVYLPDQSTIVIAHSSQFSLVLYLFIYSIIKATGHRGHLRRSKMYTFSTDFTEGWRLWPSVPWHCWSGVRKSIRPVKNFEWWGVGVVICLERGADCLRMVQLMPLHPQTPSSLASFKSRLVLPFWYQLISRLVFYLCGTVLPRLSWNHFVKRV